MPKKTSKKGPQEVQKYKIVILGHPTVARCGKKYYHKVGAQNFFTDRVPESYLPTNNCGQVPGQGYSNTPPPPLDRRSSTSPSSHAPKVNITEWRLHASESCPNPRIWCRVTSASPCISRCTILDLRGLVCQSLPWRKLCQFSLQIDDLILGGTALGVCDPLPVRTSSSC